MPANPHHISLEPAAQVFVEAAEMLPHLFTLEPNESRRMLDELQSASSPRPRVEDRWILIDGGPTGNVRARVVRPPGATGVLPVVVYLHGGGWIFGNAHTHDRIVRELAVGAHVAVVFPEYDLTPEYRFPVALDQVLTTTQWIVEYGALERLDAARLAIVGDEVGATIAISVTLALRNAGSHPFACQVLMCPATDVGFDTESYRLFARGYYTRREQYQWFWDEYCPDQRDRERAVVVPMRATDAELAELPPALVITAEADCLRDEGEAYASRLRSAGVPVLAIRYLGITSGFMILDAMRETLASRAALDQVVSTLRKMLHQGRHTVI